MVNCPHVSIPTPGLSHNEFAYYGQVVQTTQAYPLDTQFLQGWQDVP